MNRIIIEFGGVTYRTYKPKHCCRDKRSCCLFKRGVCDAEEIDKDSVFPCDPIFKVLMRNGISPDCDVTFKKAHVAK